MIKIVELGVMRSSNVNHADRRVNQIGVCGFTSLDGYTVQVSKEAASKKVIFVGTARVSDNELGSHECEPERVKGMTSDQDGAATVLRSPVSAKHRAHERTGPLVIEGAAENLKVLACCSVGMPPC